MFVQIHIKGYGNTTINRVGQRSCSRIFTWYSRAKQFYRRSPTVHRRWSNGWRCFQGIIQDKFWGNTLCSQFMEKHYHSFHRSFFTWFHLFPLSWQYLNNPKLILQVIQRRGQGYPIIVSSSPKDTKASFSLHDPSEVLTFLSRLARWRKSSSSSRSLAQIWGVGDWIETTFC